MSPLVRERLKLLEENASIALSESPEKQALEVELEALSKRLDDINLQLAQAGSMLAKTEKERDLYKAENARLRELLKLAKKKMYGSSSERSEDSGQPGLFDEAEAEVFLAEPEELVPPTKDNIVRKAKSRSGNLTNVAHLPEVDERIELPEDQRQCSHCQCPLHEMGQDLVSSKLEFVPAQLRVRRLFQVKYACRHCANHEMVRTPVASPVPPQPFGGMASPSIVAHTVMQKFELALPLYRQEQYWGHRGINLTRQTLANWVLSAGELVAPLYQHMREFLVQQPVLHADETTVQVLREAERKAKTKSFMWVYCTGGTSPPLVLFDYEATRAGRHPQDFLAGFSGYLHVDGYKAYNQVPGAILVGCWAHARRYFFDATKLGADGKLPANAPARMGLDYCNRLFAIEEKLRKLTTDERHARRQQQSAPLLKEMRAWLLQLAATVLPKSALGEAVAYCNSQWPKLESFLLDGRLELDNNRAERDIRQFVLGRKNWMFCNTPKGADAAAYLYSIVITAKANGLVASDYLNYIFENRVSGKDGQGLPLDQLLPWHPDVQAHCSKATAKDRAKLTK